MTRIASLVVSLQHGATGKRKEDQHGVVGRHRIELGERRQTVFGKLGGVPAAHRGDELARLGGLGARGLQAARRQSTPRPRAACRGRGATRGAESDSDAID